MHFADTFDYLNKKKEKKQPRGKHFQCASTIPIKMEISNYFSSALIQKVFFEITENLKHT